MRGFFFSAQGQFVHLVLNECVWWIKMEVMINV